MEWVNGVVDAQFSISIHCKIDVLNKPNNDTYTAPIKIDESPFHSNIDKYTLSLL